MFRSPIRTVLNHQKSILQQFSTIRGEKTLLSSDCVPKTSVIDSPRSISVRDAIQGGPSEEPVLVSITDRNTLKTMQANIPRDMVEENGPLHAGSAVQILGQIIPSERNGVELICDTYKVVGGCKIESLPFSINPKEKIPFGVARQHPHLRTLVRPFPSLARIRSSVVAAIHSYFNKAGYTYVTTPIITSNDCEGGGDVFEIKSPNCTDEEAFFNRKAFLSVSSQLHLEALVHSLGHVFTITPAFRAENQKSNRHLSEFTLLEVEQNFIYTVDQLMDNIEHLTRAIGSHVVENCADDFQTVIRDNTGKKYSDYEKIMHPKKYLRLTYDDCIELLNKNHKNLETIKWGQDLQRVHEKILLDYFENYPIFISHYPSHLKPFYMKRDGDKALNVDLIMNVGGEICGGSLRENDAGILRDRLQGIGQSEELNWYIELREFGCVPHGGYGIGLDRLLQAILGVENIREIVPFPRWAHHLSM